MQRTSRKLTEMNKIQTGVQEYVTQMNNCKKRFPLLPLTCPKSTFFVVDVPIADFEQVNVG